MPAKKVEIDDDLYREWARIAVSRADKYEQGIRRWTGNALLNEQYEKMRDSWLIGMLNKDGKAWINFKEQREAWQIVELTFGKNEATSIDTADPIQQG